jgi:hypothetical protein
MDVRAERCGDDPYGVLQPAWLAWPWLVIVVSITAPHHEQICELILRELVTHAVAGAGAAGGSGPWAFTERATRTAAAAHPHLRARRHATMSAILFELVLIQREITFGFCNSGRPGGSLGRQFFE